MERNGHKEKDQGYLIKNILKEKTMHDNKRINDKNLLYLDVYSYYHDNRRIMIWIPSIYAVNR